MLRSIGVIINLSVYTPWGCLHVLIMPAGDWWPVCIQCEQRSVTEASEHFIQVHNSLFQAIIIEYIVYYYRPNRGVMSNYIYKRHYSLDSFFHHVYSYNLIHRIYNIFKNKSVKNDVNKILNKYVIYQSGLESKFYRNTNGVKTWKGLPLGEKLPLNIYWQYRLI